MKNRLRELRKNKKLTQVQIQILFNIEQTEISRMELNKRDPTVCQLMEFAKFYETSMDYIMYLTDNPKPYIKTKEK